MVKSNNEVYAWGFGENYVLGNREDQNEHKPYKLDPRMFEEKKVVQIACGTQHVCALIQENEDAGPPEMDFSSFVKVASKMPVKPPKEPKEGEEEGEEDDDEPELPEFSKGLGLKSLMSTRERAKATPNGGKAQEVKASDATTAV